MGRLAAGIAAVVLFAALSTGAVLLGMQNSHLQAQVNSQAAQRDARHATFCAYLHAEAGLGSVPPPLAALASRTYTSEDCAPPALP